MPTDRLATITAIVLFAMMSLGCPETRYSETMTELATVVEVVYTPSQHGSGVSPGFSTSGNMVMTFTSVNIDPVFAVVFQCQHGKFIIKRRSLWERLQKGQRVMVSYREIHEVDGDSVRLTGYDFLDAEVLND